MQTVEFETFGQRFKVVDPTSMGFKHTTHEFSDHEPVLEAWVRGIHEGDFVVDAGAQFGSYTMPALAAGARVFAYEPSDDAAHILQHNAAVNGWDAFARFRLRQFCLWDGTAYPEELARQVFGQHYPAQRLRFVRLDDDLREFGVGKVHHLKLDVEGAELGVLRGAGQTIFDHRPRLVIECHESVSQDPKDEVSRYPERIQSDRQMRTLLLDLGYQIEIVPWDVSRRYWVCTYPR